MLGTGQRTLRNLVDDVRYDCVGHWPAHTEKKAKVCTMNCSLLRG